MIIEHKYARLERTIYTFDEADIRNALMKYANISEYKPGRRVEFELDEDGATLTLIHESPQEDTHDAP